MKLKEKYTKQTALQVPEKPPLRALSGKRNRPVEFAPGSTPDIW
jgi:hypothetical protein